MSPEKTQELKSGEAIYSEKKHQLIINLSKLVTVAKLGLYIREEGERIRK